MCPEYRVTYLSGKSVNRTGFFGHRLDYDDGSQGGRA
jgi:hypothetical protein